MAEDCTILKDRVLWFDGASSVEPDPIADMVLRGVNIKKGVYVSKLTKEIEEFNKISDFQLKTKDGINPLSFEWNVPEKYKTMNLRKHFLSLLEAEVERKPKLKQSEIEARLDRVDHELDMFYKGNLNSLLRTTIYIVDTFKQKDVVWGVGRGSSCSSYLLYLADVHSIDSVHYDLDIEDFIR